MTPSELLVDFERSTYSNFGVREKLRIRIKNHRSAFYEYLQKCGIPHAPLDEESLDKLYKKFFCWTTQEGRELHIFSMSDKHLDNTYLLLNRRSIQVRRTHLLLFYLTHQPSGEHALDAHQAEMDNIDRLPDQMLPTFPKDVRNTPIYAAIEREILLRDNSACVELIRNKLGCS